MAYADEMTEFSPPAFERKFDGKHYREDGKERYCVDVVYARFPGIEIRTSVMGNAEAKGTP